MKKIIVQTNKKEEDRIKSEDCSTALLFNKKAVALEFLFWLILGVVVLVIVIFIIMILTGKGEAAIDFIKDLFKFSFVVIISPSTSRFNNYLLIRIN
ncbi:MAG: hypothetical protein AABW90_03200 [Nanoarchaeota archaeon]|mgnify:CR=1 FL=1